MSWRREFWRVRVIFSRGIYEILEGYFFNRQDAKSRKAGVDLGFGWKRNAEARSAGRKTGSWSRR